MPERGTDPAADPGAADAVDAYWDALIDGPPAAAPPPGLDPDLGAAVRLVHGLPAPRPAAAFVARLEEELTMGPRQTPAALTPAAAAIGPSATPSPNGRCSVPPPVPVRPARRRVWGRAVEVAAAAALLLAIGGGLIAGWGLRPERSGETPTGAPGLAQATPPAGDAGTAMVLGNAARTGEVPGPGPTGEPARLWSAPIAPGQDGWITSAPIAADGIAYVTGAILAPDAAETQEHALLALDLATGEERWRATDRGVDDLWVALSAPAVADGLVYVGTTVFPESADPALGTPEADAAPSGFLVARDARTGEERWRAPTGGSADSSPAVVDGVVYAASGDGHVSAFDAATGARRWRSASALVGLAGEDTVWIPEPAVADGLVYVAGGGAVLALDAATGAERWRHETGHDGVNDGITGPVVAGGIVYVGSSAVPDKGGADAPESRLHALDAATGEERWAFVPDRLVQYPPVVGGDTVYVADGHGGGWDLVALDAASGRERWRADAGRHLTGHPVLADGVLYATAYDAGLLNHGFSFLGAGVTLSAFDAATGGRFWQIEVGDSSVGRLAVADGTVYVVDEVVEDEHDAGTLSAYGD